jgi:LacI family transcriptional regulator
MIPYKRDRCGAAVTWWGLESARTERRLDQRPSRRRQGGRTIHDVARHAGVSPMTVSRVINGEQNVRDSTRVRVREAIAALGYAPNPAARSLAKAQTLRIGLLYSNPSAAYLSEFLLGSLDQCSRSAIQLTVEKCDPEDGELAAVEHLIANGLDGVILPPPLCESQAVVSRLVAADVPTVAVASGEPFPEVSAIRIDDLHAAEAMTRRLIDQGHRRIGFVKGHPNQTASALRLAGYSQALSAAGLATDEALIVQGYFTYASGMEAAETLFGLEAPPTAVFASNDDMAAAIVAVAHRRGLDVPRDVTVVGFDDTTLATTLWPPLTTIRQPVADMSRRAVQILAETILRRQSGKAVRIARELTPFALVERQSDAPPRSEAETPRTASARRSRTN